jgi:site-specific DNA-adenine methylase
MYGRKIEPYKRAYHYAIVFDDFEPFRELFDDETTEKIKKSLKGITDLKERRLKFTKALGDYILSLERCEHLERKERLDLLNHTMCLGGSPRHINENLECKERIDILQPTNIIEVLNKDYNDVELPLPEDCVIYCDIPYQKTWQYKVGDFNYERFYKWCQEKTSEGYQIYVSSYELPEDLFIEVWSKGRHSKATSGSGKHVVEKIYTIRK